MMTETIKPDLADVVELMDRVLREVTTVADEFPLVFRTGFSGQVVSMGDDESIRSTCAILLREAICPDANYKLGLIGSVSTDNGFRGTGLATSVLLSGEQRLAEQGAVISMLWADDPRFYFARGYRPIGSENDFIIDEAVLRGLPVIDGSCVASAENAEAIHQHYCNHKARMNRSLDETVALLECPGMSTLVHVVDGKVLAYACMGRGEDLDGTVHEWGGAIESVLGLLRVHAETNPSDKPTFLIAPCNENELVERMTAIGSPPVTGLLGLAKIINRGAAAGLLMELLGEHAVVNYNPNAIEAEQVQIVTANGSEYLNDDTLLVLLFSGKGERAETIAFGDYFGIDVDKLPLQTFAWGLDSI
ncbi:MAG: hypothetical protein ACI8TQ_003943 [Planctomycetota bacterium]|jgi:hypothetical protein